ncbi:MAG TPA: hypothetical protein VEC18_06475, partial [Myxococcota bacterium]|nr:hypothetical protein [Myxococcota bacterium]
RGALMLTDARFDAIVSQPSHPWTAGASHLYTREFFTLVSDHLEPGGVLVQWIGLAFVDEPLLRSLVATLLDVFPEVHVFRPISGAVLFVASNAPVDPLQSARHALAASPQDYARYGLLRVEDLASAWVLDAEGARRFAAGASLNTDDRNQLATRSAALGKRAIRARDATEILLPLDPLPARASQLERLYLMRSLVQRSERVRAVNLANGIEDPAQRWTALGWARIVDSPRQAASHFRSALALDPDAELARFGLLALQRNAVEAGDPAALELAAPLGGVRAAVVAGWRLAADADWSALRALEPALGSAQWFDPAYRDALRLRVRWRAASDEPSLRAEAAELASALLQDRVSSEDLLVGAQAFGAASRFQDALQLLDELSRMRRDRRSSLAAVELLDAIPADVEPALQASVRDRLERRRAPARNAAMAEAARARNRARMEGEPAERDAKPE